MDLREQARRKRRTREALSGRPIILAATRTLQRRLDRFWPGVVLAFNPSLKQFILQDRRSKCSKGWYTISVMEPLEWPTFQGLMRHIQSINVSGLQSSWDRKRWYKEKMGDPAEQLADLNERSLSAALMREGAEKIASKLQPKVIVPGGI